MNQSCILQCTRAEDKKDLAHLQLLSERLKQSLFYLNETWPKEINMIRSDYIRMFQIEKKLHGPSADMNC